MDKLITITRNSKGLFALISRLKYKFKNTLEHPKENSLKELAEHYESIEIPLNLLDKKLFQQKDKILNVWESLSHVENFDKNTLEQILLIEETTYCDFAELNDLPPLALVENKKEFKPTAAHPRAYNGTKHQPPKTKKQTSFNLQPYLCNENSLNKILQEFNLFKEKKDKLPKHFVKYLLPSIKKLDENKVPQFLEVFWSLELEKNFNLLMHITRLLLLSQDIDKAFNWSCLVIRQKPRCRTIFITLLIKSGVFNLDASVTLAKNIETFNSLTPRKYYVSRLFFFFLAVKKGISLEHIFVGFTLANKYYKSYVFTDLTNALNPSIQAIEAIFSQLKELKHVYPYKVMGTWQYSAYFPDFVDTLLSVNWQKIPTKLHGKYLSLFLDNIDFDLKEETIKLKWNFIREISPTIERLLLKISGKYQEKFLANIDDFCWRWGDVKGLRECFKTTCFLLERLCSEPFKEKTYSEKTLNTLVWFSNKTLKQVLLNAPNSSFFNLEKTCYSKNDSNLIFDAIHSLMTILPDFTIMAFLHFSSLLMKLAKRLGSLNSPSRLLLVSEFKNHQIMTTDFPNLPLEQSTLIIKNIIEKNIFNPVSDKLIDLIKKGENDVNKTFKYYKEEMFKNLYRTKLEILGELLVNKSRKAYAKTLDKEDRNIDYALQIASYIDSNQRPLRKFLKAYLRGDKNYLRNHPQTLSWLKKHPKLNLELWNQGIEFKKLSPKHGEIFIELEQDPLEVLKMGTYVGSCLGLGGAFTYSAAAVALDINKKVLYARNNKKQVLARQLIAISEENTLVCFWVYPGEVDKKLSIMFRDYDRLFAQALKLSLHNDSQQDNEENKRGDYEIANIISKEWWDDCAWDLSL